MEIVTINAMWCPGCIIMHKTWTEVKKIYPDILFTSYDYDMDEDIVKSFSPGDILPITILLKEGKEVDRINGEVEKEKIIEMIERYK